MVYNPFCILLNFVCWYFVEDFYVHMHKEFDFLVFFSYDVFFW
jgi:hypothetical protein